MKGPCFACVVYARRAPKCADASTLAAQFLAVHWLGDTATKKM